MMIWFIDAGGLMDEGCGMWYRLTLSGRAPGEDAGENKDMIY